MGLKRRGLIKNGFKADLTIFSLEDLSDKSNFLEPGIYPDGLKYILVNGEIIINNFKGTGKLAGKFLRNKFEWLIIRLNRLRKLRYFFLKYIWK